MPPSSCSHGSGSGGGSVGPQPGMFVPPMPVYGYGPPRTGMGCCESDIADDESKTREYEKSDGRKMVFRMVRCNVVVTSTE